jgi:excisionase family DNA binding protein
MTLEKEFYTQKELAALLAVAPLTVARMTKRGQVKAHKFGRALRYRREDVEAFIASCHK